MTKVLVTGAAGFIGSHVTRLLVEQGRDVRALVRPGEKTDNIDGLPIEKVQGDILDPVAVEAALDGCDTLYHLAAIYAVWLPDERIIYDVNVRGSEIVLAAARKQRVKKVVYTSSIAALGLGSRTRPATEATPWNYGWLANAYIRSKYEGQLVAMRNARQGLPVVIVNPAFPFGDQDIGPTPTGKIILDILNRKVPGYIEGGFNAVDVRDVAAGHLLAEAKGRPGECYILGNRNLSIRELHKLVGQLSGVRAPDRKIPIALITGMAAASELVANFTKRPPIATLKSVLLISRYLYYDITKACQELGYKPRPLEEGLARAIVWFRENGYVQSVRSRPVVRA